MKVKKTSRIIVIIYWILFLVPFIGLSVLFYMISIGKMGYIPPFEELENPKSNIASELISSDNVQLGKYFKQNRSIADYDEISPFVINALLATEDIRFFQHSGIDQRGLARAVFKTLILQEKHSGGASTITQQLAKQLYHNPSSRFYERLKQKANEWVIATKLEKRYTKKEIISMYLNQFDFLNLAVGIKSAARIYFDTKPDSLNLEQSAMLVGMLKNPSIYNPLRRPDTTKYRRNVVLAQMLKYSYITQPQYDSLKTLPLDIKFQRVDHNLGSATYFREYIRTRITASKPQRERYASYQTQKYLEDSADWENDPLYGWCNKNIKPDGTNYNLYSDGLRIYTTINSKMQEYAEDAVKEHLGKTLQVEFNEEKEGRKKGPFANDLSVSQIKNILAASMRRSERYRVLKKAGMTIDSIRANFKKPVPMTVFSWHGDIDTVMTPLDSIRYYKYFLNAGFMSMEPQTGYVRAYVGGLDHRYFKYDHVTYARRQVGSTFKPFLYTLAMMPGEKYDPCYKVPNIPYTIKMPPGSEEPFYTPRYSTNNSYLKPYEGKNISLKFGLSHSLNQISAWVMKQYTPEAAIKIAREMGVKSPIEPVYSICVGAAEVRLAEMVAAYGTFGNNGIYTEPIFVTRIEDKNGNPIETFKPLKQEAISSETAFKMISMMKGVVDNGTSKRLRYKYDFSGEMAGKTGTTNDNSDGWFIGITPELVSGGWVGGEVRSIRFDNTLYGQGAHMALPIWALYMKQVYADETLPYTEEAKFEVPLEMQGIEYNCNDNQGTLEQQENGNELFEPDENLFNL